MSESVAHFQSPVGALQLQANQTHILSILRVTDSEPNNDTNDNPILSECTLQLQEYFDGKRRNFELPLAPYGTPFQEAVWKRVAEIPFGKTNTYGEIAQRCGDFKKNRAVGTANGQNPILIIIPCHRVIGANGSLTGYSAGIDMKEWLINHEQKVTGTYQTNIFE